MPTDIISASLFFMCCNNCNGSGFIRNGGNKSWSGIMSEPFNTFCTCTHGEVNFLIYKDNLYNLDKVKDYFVAMANRWKQDAPKQT